VTPTIRLSVVVPTRDTCELTLACLAAVSRAAAAERCEIVLVDDGSEDGTVDRVRVSFPRVRLLRHDAPAGFTSAANTGLRAASGSILLLLNSDTEVQPDGFRALMDAFERDPALGIAGAQLLNRDGSPQWSGGRSPDCLWLFAEASGVVRQVARLPGYRRLRPLARSTDRDVAWVSGAALAMRRSVWQRLEPLDESFRLYGQDLDFCTRAVDAGWKIRVLRDFSVLHHQGATVATITRTADRHPAEYLWTDLLRWSTKTRGAAYARRAALALSIGARVRLFARRLITPAVAGARRDRWSDQDREIRAALDALRDPAL
jgi:N-acetylglucosaminyl-diphospho-decaprenol L-rhamnosyltransferase